MTELATGEISAAELLLTDMLPTMKKIHNESIDVGMDQKLHLAPELLGLDEAVTIHQIIGFPDAEAIISDQPIDMHQKSRKLLALVSYTDDNGELQFAVTGHELPQGDDQPDTYDLRGRIAMQPGEKITVGRNGNSLNPDEWQQKTRLAASGDRFVFASNGGDSGVTEQRLGSVATSRLFGVYDADGNLSHPGSQFMKLVSNEHLTIVRTEAGFTVTDHSLYGTTVAEVPKKH